LNARDRVAEILARARIDGGWIDEDVADAVLVALGLDADGKPVATESDEETG
jgi:hypothetical protein